MLCSRNRRAADGPRRLYEDSHFPMSANAAPPTIHLRERTSRTVRLPASAVAFLVDRHRDHLHLEPTGCHDHYRVRPRGVVGVITAPGCRLVISPKVPLRNLFVMLGDDEPIDAQTDRVEASPADAIVTFLAGQLAQRLHERVQAGLHWAYVEQSEAGSQLHGRLDAAAQARQSAGRKDCLHSVREEMTVDLPCNRVPRALAEQLLAWPSLAASVTSSLRETLAGLEDVQVAAWTLEEVHQLAEEPPCPEYRPLLELCLLLAEGLIPGLASGSRPAPTFLLNMERAFESFVTRGIVKAFAGDRWLIEVQRSRLVSDAVPGQTPLLMRPDVVVCDGDRPVLVIDTKWKSLRGGLPRTDDLHQMLAYAAGLGATRLVLVHPGARNRVWSWRLPASAVEVQTRTLGVTGSARDCQRFLRRLGRQLRDAIDAGD